MVLLSSSWDFSDSVGHHRLDLLNNPPPFEEIARTIARVMHVKCTHVGPCDEAYGFSRFVACVVVDKALFDIFFNSYNGYRGWYYRSPTDGLRMNALLVSLLAPILIEFQQHEGMSADFSLKSLAAPSAKCWLAEAAIRFCPKCEGDWSIPKDDSPEILNGRWDTAQMPNSRFGVKAPYLEKLRVMGGFVNQAGEHYVVKRKTNRAQEIHDVGWS
jgi:hypothetical protein